MTELFNLLILFTVGCLAGLINVTAGGGSTLTLPVLIFLGLDGVTANGTNRIAIFIQSVSSVYSFKREKYFHLRESLILSAYTLPGAIIGAFFAVKISGALFEKLLGLIMILIILSMIIPSKKKNYSGGETGRKSIWVYLSMFGIGFYGGFIQVGVGYLLMAALHQLMKLNLVYVNMHKVFVVFVFTIPALLIFIFSGNVNWFLGFILAAGNALGGWWGAKFSVRKGEKFIKIILAVSVLIMALKLLGMF